MTTKKQLRLTQELERRLREYKPVSQKFLPAILADRLAQSSGAVPKSNAGDSRSPISVSSADAFDSEVRRRLALATQTTSKDNVKS
jgi:hypothetical protein